MNQYSIDSRMHYRLHYIILFLLLTTGHLFLEHLDHVVEVAGTSNFSKHGVEFRLVHELADVVEGSAEIGFAEGAIFVDVH